MGSFASLWVIDLPELLESVCIPSCVLSCVLEFNRWDPDVVERVFNSVVLELTNKGGNAANFQKGEEQHEYKFSCLVKTESVEYCKNKIGKSNFLFSLQLL